MKKRQGSPALLIFLCCVLAVPTVGVLMGLVPPDVKPEAARPALLVGALLGILAYHEPANAAKLLGMALIFGAVILLNLGGGQEETAPGERAE